MQPEARALYEQGLALYQAKDYAGAIRVLEKGFALEPRREFLFTNAQARRLSGDCRGAVPLYQRFLEMSPPPVQASATHIALARCAQQLAAAPTPPVAPLVERPAAPPAAPPPPWWHDRAGAALLGASVAALGVGTGFLLASFSARPSDDGGPTGPTYEEFRRRAATADQRLTISLVSLAAGGALAAGGIARYAWVRHRARAGATLTVVPGGIALGGWF